MIFDTSKKLYASLVLILSVSAGFAWYVGEKKTASLLLIVALINVAITLSKRGKAAHGQWLSLQKEAHWLITWASRFALALTLLLAFMAARGAISIDRAIIFGISIGTAVAPTGLIAAATLLANWGTGKKVAQNIRNVMHAVITTNVSELVLVVASIAGVLAFHIPEAVTAIQIIAIDVVALLLPLVALGWDAPPHKYDKLFHKHALSEFIYFGLVVALLAYLNYLFFFARQGLSPVYIDTSSLLYAQATSLTYVTLVFCQFVNILFVRAHERERFFGRHLWDNRILLAAFAAATCFVAGIVYNPWLQTYFGTAELGLIDWATAVACALIFGGLRLVQRHTRLHTRHAVIRLHKDIHAAQ